jgi:hypothetical protein
MITSIIPVADIYSGLERFKAAGLPGGFALIAFFPATAPETKTTWEGLASLAAPGGIVIIGMASAEAERFDRKKHKAFTRLGDVKRKGFRAMAYVKPTVKP